MEAYLLHNRSNQGDAFEVASPTHCADPVQSGIRARTDLSAYLAGIAAGLEDNSETRSRTQRLVDRAILHIDRAISHQLDAILHHPRLQKLEASWRSLFYLVETKAEYDEELSVKVKVLNVGWTELAKDVTRALEFDQSHLFRRLYSDEFDTPGGEPFGVILGDYEVSHRMRPGVAASDIEVLREIGQVATAALCPYITGAAGTLFGVDSMGELTQPINLHDLFQQREYVGWQALRTDEAARFLGIALPRVLARAPYRDDGTRHEGLVYRENVSNSREHYLWGAACYAFGSVLIRAFANTGWFADIRGGVHEFGEGGVVRHLNHTAFDFDCRSIGSRSATELQIDDFAEREFSDFGFVPLCSHHSAEHSVFYSNSSLHAPAHLGSDIANANGRLAAMIQYMLCVSRFGHYIKIIGRDKIGSFVHAEECQRILQNWLNQYTTSSEGGSAELKARYPLAASRADVHELPGRPGHFTCVVHLQPHFQLDDLVTTIRLVTELAVGAVSSAT